jgi:putative membrane protein
MLPAGFLGSRGDVLIDLVVLSFALILPLLILSWRFARRREYSNHRRVQLGLALVLAVAVTMFEVDLKLSGGIFELTRDSAYAGTTLLNSIIYGHTLVAIGSVLVWVPLIFISLRRFGNPPVPGAFSATHRFWGRTGMLLMMASGLSALPLYYLGFIL